MLPVVDLTRVFTVGPDGASAPTSSPGSAWGEACGTPRRPTSAGRAPADDRFRTGLTPRAAGEPKASPVRGESPVRADPPPGAGKEAAPNQRRRDHPREAPGITASCGRLGAKPPLLAIDGTVPKGMADGLSRFMRDDGIGDVFAPCSTMAPQVTVETASALRVVPYGIEGRLAEGPLEGRAPLLGVPAAPADRAGWGPPGPGRQEEETSRAF
jgi:hypothetical protein